MKTAKRIGFTTSLPIEVILAAGHIPVDLNNLFVTGNPGSNVSQAELKGFPRTICSWIKGNYIAALSSNLDEVIGIIQGDCSNTHSILNLLEEEGKTVRYFSFPPSKKYEELDRQISDLENHYGVSRGETLKVKQRLDRIRKKLIVLDEWTYEERIVSGKENHYWLVNSSDFWGDPDLYEAKLDDFMADVSGRKPLQTRLRLAYIGVPPIYLNLYDKICELGGDVIYNEVQRQFAMPNLCEDIIEQYLDYTYPYSVFDRLEDIKSEIQRRGVGAIISYTQSFCHLQIDNILLKKHIKLPFLTLEGDQPEEIDSRTLLRLESFFEIHA